jgi:hypothetical protein
VHVIVVGLLKNFICHIQFSLPSAHIDATSGASRTIAGYLSTGL